jgi:histidinol-phosphate aminotransferase
MNPYWSALAGALVPYVPGEQPRIENLVKLNTNESPFAPSPKVFEAIRAAAADSLRLYPDPEATELRETLAAYHGVAASQIFVGNGSDEVLAHTFAALLKHDKPLLFPDVTYSFYPVYAQLHGVVCETVAVDAAMRINIADYRRPAGAIVIANPNAPTGIALPIDDVAALADEHRDIPVVIDEAYIDFGGTSALTLLNERPNLLIVRTMSKSRALAGLRVGYAIGDPALIEALTRVKDSFNSYPLGRPAQAGAIASIQDEPYFQARRADVLHLREIMTAGLAKLGFEVLPSSANFVFARHEALAGAEGTKRLRERAVLVRHFAKPRIADFLRITVGTEGEIGRLIEACREILATDHRG